MPGNPSPPVVSILGLGVGVGSTDTTDLIGETRGGAVGLLGSNGGEEEEDEGIGELVPCPSSSCGLGLHGPRPIFEPHGNWV